MTMERGIFALKITKENGQLNFKAHSRNFNVFEVIAYLRRYCDVAEKDNLDNNMKNIIIKRGADKNE